MSPSRRSLLLAVLATCSIGGAATALAQTGEPQEGDCVEECAAPQQPATGDFDVVENDVLDGGADMDVAAKYGIPIRVECGLFQGRQQVADAPCNAHIKAMAPAAAVKILHLKSRVLASGTLTPPKYASPDDAPRHASDEDLTPHLKLKPGVAAKIKPAGWIKGVRITGYVVGPKGEKVSLKAGDGDWGREIKSGIVCPTKDISVAIRPHNSKPYCPGPGGFGGVATVGWYQG